MPSIPSPNPDFAPIDSPSNQPPYSHGADSRRTFIPMAFQVTSPFEPTRALLPHALVMHINPASFSETFNKKKETIQTRGGFVEQHWGDDLSDISADGSTGAFMNIHTGLSSVIRQRTIAWDRYRDLYDLFRNNGSVYDPFGTVVLQGRIMLMYDRGTYLGYFKSFEVEETADSPFAFHMSWTFRVQEVLLKIPDNLARPSISQVGFQAQNQSGLPANATALNTPAAAPPTQAELAAVNSNTSFATIADLTNRTPSGGG